MNWRKEIHQTDIPNQLQCMLDFLVKESAVGDGTIEAGGCTELFLNNDMPSDLLRVSENDVPIGFRAEVIKFLSSLISILDGKLLIQNAIHRPTLHLMKMCAEDHKHDDLLLDLEYNIVTKIREYPDLLHIFFMKNFVPKNVTKESVTAGQLSTNSSLNTSPNRKASVADLAKLANSPRNNDYDFLLFDHLLRYIHQGDQNGDVARTAVLFLLELYDVDLAEYIYRSDLSTVVIAGLGGLFSQLPQALPASLTDGTDSFDKRKQIEVADFYDDLASFLNLLGFVQKIMLVCPHSKITDKLLQDLKQTFLDNIILNSITSSSDFDGTAATCIFYITEMIRCVNEYRLSMCFSRFLLQSDDDASTANAIISSDNGMGSDDCSIEEIRLHLRDIIVSKLGSLSESVVTSILLLLHTLLQYHNETCLSLLFEKLPIESTMIELDHEYHYVALQGCISLLKDGGNALNEFSLKNYLYEAETMAQTYQRVLRKGASSSHGKSAVQTILFNPQTTDQASISSIPPPSKAEIIATHQLQDMGKDTILRKFINKFSTFFSHSFEINLALTGLIAQIASAPHPALYMYMFYSDSLISGGGECSLLTILKRLQAEIVDFQRDEAAALAFPAKLAQARVHVYVYKGGRQGHYMAPNDLDDEFYWNCVLLEEVAKELVAIILNHSLDASDYINYR